MLALAGQALGLLPLVVGVTALSHSHLIDGETGPPLTRGTSPATRPGSTATCGS